MARRGGLFSRIANAVRGIFTRAEEPPRRAPVPPQPPGRGAPPRPPKQPPNPYLDSWRSLTSERTGYLDHRDIIDNMALEYDLDAEDKLELWDDYLEYIVGRRGERMSYRRNDVRNPFWQKWGIDPDGFDWDAWREAMGY